MRPALGQKGVWTTALDGEQGEQDRDRHKTTCGLNTSVATLSPSRASFFMEKPRTINDFGYLLSSLCPNQRSGWESNSAQSLFDHLVGGG
jgi:hypothetical protein